MILWLFAFLLLAALAVVGFYQGAIRVAFSFVGLLMAAVLAVPLGGLFKIILPPFGLHHPVLLAFLGPFLMYLLLLIIFKSAGLAVHKKVDTHYKYKESDTKRLLFQRLNERLGLCLGLANGAVYLVLLSMVAYSAGYFTVQVASSDRPEKDTFMMKLINRVSEDLVATKMDKAVAPFVPLTENYFDGADIIGDVLHQPLLQSKLSSYPPFLMLSERAEFKELAGQEFQSFWLGGPSVNELKANPKIEPLLGNVDLYTNIMGLVNGDLKDLKEYVETGKSAKYDDEKILGRWKYQSFDSFALAKRKKPNMTSQESRFLRARLNVASEALFTATVDNRAILKIPSMNLPATNKVLKTIQGEWKNESAGRYTLSVSDEAKKVELPAAIEGGKLIITKDNLGLVFGR